MASIRRMSFHPVRLVTVALLVAATFWVSSTTTAAIVPRFVTPAYADGPNGCWGWQKDATYVTGNYYNHGWAGYCAGSGLQAYSGGDDRYCWGCSGNVISSLMSHLQQYDCWGNVIFDQGLTVYSDWQVAVNSYQYDSCTGYYANGENVEDGLYDWTYSLSN